MKILLIAMASLLFMSFTAWEPDFNKALEKAKARHELVLLNFSGSDWCGPCMRMKKEIFENPEFAAMADSNILMVNADFPRNKKNQLTRDLQKKNDALAEKYNPEGKFPYTLLLDENGKIIKAWDGLPDEDATAFAIEVKNLCDAIGSK